ncbi:MAG: type II toxin-antitoxin system CcdA family antitoxin, partial [Candidatus Bathyarchaeia archaeon]
MKVRTNILIEESVLRTAQNLGINVSKFCENALKIGIQALTNSLQKIAENQTASTEKEGFGNVVSENEWCGRRDLNPGRQRGREFGEILPSLSEKTVNWEDFEKWLLRD